MTIEVLREEKTKALIKQSELLARKVSLMNLPIAEDIRHRKELATVREIVSIERKLKSLNDRIIKVRGINLQKKIVYL